MCVAGARLLQEAVVPARNGACWRAPGCSQCSQAGCSPGNRKDVHSEVPTLPQVSMYCLLSQMEPQLLGVFGKKGQRF